MVGRKSKVLFDSIDLEIVNTIEANEGIGVLELAGKLDLTHQNLKTHLEKLLRADIIHTITESSLQQEGKKIKFLTINSGFYESDNAGGNDQLLKMKRKQFNDFLLYIRAINGLDYEKETLAEIINSLKKKERKQLVVLGLNPKDNKNPKGDIKIKKSTS